MKKNIYDTDIEMVDLDSVGNLEFRYEELGSPNPELGNDIEMVMKETQVFSAEEVARALEKPQDIDLDKTRVIDIIDNPEGFLNDDEIEETMSEEREYYSDNVPDGYSRETDENDGYDINTIEFEALNEEPFYETENETSDEFVNENEGYAADDESEYVSEDEEYAAEDEPEYASEEEYVSENEVYEEDLEPEFDDIPEEKEIRKTVKKEKKPVQKHEKVKKEKQETFETVEEDESYDFEEDVPDKKALKKSLKEEKKLEKAEKEKREKLAEKERKAEERKAEKESKASHEEKVKKEKAVKEKKESPKVSAKQKSEAKKSVAPAKVEKPVKAADTEKEKRIKRARRAEAEENIQEEIAEEVEELIDNVIDTENEEVAENETIIEIENNAGRTERDIKRRKKKGIGIIEFLEIGIALVLLVLIVVLGVKLLSNSRQKDNIQQFASVGALFSDITEIGNPGIEAIGNKAYIDSINPDNGDDTGEENNNPDENNGDNDDNTVDDKVSPISVNFSSIEKDLKIKFLDKASGKLVTGVRFEVTAKGPSGEDYDWIDTDLDGIIYINNLKPGNYDVKVVSVGAYEFPETATKVKVQDTVVYQVINIIDEAQDMNDVDLSKEENSDKDVDKGDVLEDTVEFVESTATPIDGQDGFVKIDKTKIKDPRSADTAYNDGGFRRVDDIRLKVGEVARVITVLEGFSLSWDGNNDVAAGSEDGSIRGISPGTVTLTSRLRDAEGNEIAVQSWNITVSEEQVPAPGKKVDSISINGQKDIKVGETLTLTANVSPEDAENKQVEWSSENPDVASVDQNGVVTGKGAGLALIKATAKDGGGASASVSIAVTEVPKIKLTITDPDGKNVPDKIELYSGETYQLKAVVEGYTTDAGVSFSSSNNAVTVSDSGLISAVTAGTADVTVSTVEKDSNGNPVSKTISVTVKDDSESLAKPLTYNKDGQELQVYYKTADGKYVEAKRSDYYKYDEFYIKGAVEYKYTGWQTIDGNVYYFTKDGVKVTGEQVILGTKYFFASDGSLINDSGSRGIDVSTYNGTIDWTAVKNSGISFVIIRCGFRGYTKGGLIMDSKYKSYIQGATAAGLKVGLYFYSQAINQAEAVEEASLCVNLAQGYKISYPIFLDSEYANGSRSGRADGLDKGTRTAVCKAFCETIKSAGYTPGIYASKSWFYDKLDVSQLNSYKIWLAHYCSQTDYTGKYDIWQHTEKGSVNGIKGKVDLDISYMGY